MEDFSVSDLIKLVAIAMLAVMFITAVASSCVVIYKVFVKKDIAVEVAEPEELSSCDIKLLAMYIETVVDQVDTAEAILRLVESGAEISNAIYAFDKTAEFYPNPGTDTYMAIFEAENRIRKEKK